MHSISISPSFSTCQCGLRHQLRSNVVSARRRSASGRVGISGCFARQRSMRATMRAGHRTLSNLPTPAGDDLVLRFLTTGYTPLLPSRMRESRLCLNSKRASRAVVSRRNAVDDHCGAVMLDRMGRYERRRGDIDPGMVQPSALLAATLLARDRLRKVQGVTRIVACHGPRAGKVFVCCIATMTLTKERGATESEGHRRHVNHIRVANHTSPGKPDLPEVVHEGHTRIPTQCQRVR